METVELLAVLERGEDSRHQFKKNMSNNDSLAAEMVAFSNSDGGQLIIGVDDVGNVVGLSPEEVQDLNQRISNAASQGVIPAINPMTSNILVGDSIVLVIDIPRGVNGPYQDKSGAFWVKSGSDKRKATSREEIQRLFQETRLIYADETPIKGLSVADMDIDFFKSFFSKRYGEELDDQNLPLQKVLENMNLCKDGDLNLACALLFCRAPQYKLPAFIVRAGSFDANEISTSSYDDSKNIEGKLTDIFKETIGFIISNLHHIQGDQGVNSIGTPEIPRESIEELVANALIHRDYFVSAPVRVFVFRNRVEIISPGHLPNCLTVENIKAGNSNSRNPLLASYANHLIPYRGYGSGIIRALSKYPDIEFVDDRDGNLFKAIIKRRTQK